MSDVRHVLASLLGVEREDDRLEREDDRLEVVVDLDPESVTPESESILTLRFSGCAATAEALAELDSALAEGVGLRFSSMDVTNVRDDAAFYATMIERGVYTAQEVRQQIEAGAHPDA